MEYLGYMELLDDKGRVFTDDTYEELLRDLGEYYPIAKKYKSFFRLMGDENKANDPAYPFLHGVKSKEYHEGDRVVAEDDIVWVSVVMGGLLVWSDIEKWLWDAEVSGDKIDFFLVE
jgi:hypothetical protein